MPPQLCGCGSGRLAEPRFDGNSIYLCSACSECWPERKKQFRPEIVDHPYTQADVDEPIDPDD